VQSCIEKNAFCRRYSRCFNRRLQQELPQPTTPLWGVAGLAAIAAHRAPDNAKVCLRPSSLYLAIGQATGLRIQPTRRKLAEPQRLRTHLHLRPGFGLTKKRRADADKCAKRTQAELQTRRTHSNPHARNAQVLPYLVRRTQENSAVVQGAAVTRQMAMPRSEIGRRVLSSA